MSSSVLSDRTGVQSKLFSNETFLRLDVSQLVCATKPNGSMEITCEELQLCPHSVMKDYQSVIQSANIQLKQEIKFTLNQTSDKFTIFLKNTQIFVLSRMIDEIIYFSDVIKEQSEDFKKYISRGNLDLVAARNLEVEEKRRGKNEVSKFKTILIFQDVTLVNPRNSKSNASLKLKIKSAELVIGRQCE